MYAVIKTGGKQYRVAANDTLEIEKLSGKVGDWVQFQEILMVGGDGTAEVGKPLVKGASVAAEVIEQGRGDKVIIFKKRRRHNYRRKKGHRQELTTVRITEILTGGKAPSQTAFPAKWDAEVGRQATMRATQPRGTAHPGAGGRAFTLLSAAEESGADDLGRIAGVAEKTVEVLNEYGIYHFWQVAALKDNDIQALEAELKFPGRIKREEWREQARELMDGGVSRAKVDRAGIYRKFVKLSAPEGGKADDLSLIGGVGEKIVGVLSQHGIYHFWQVAGMTDAEIANLEKDLAFPGRVKREEWREQARELMAGRKPRAKVDRNRSA